MHYWKGYEVLTNVAALVLLNKMNHHQTGYQILFTFEAGKFQTYNNDVLTASILKRKK